MRSVILFFALIFCYPQQSAAINIRGDYGDYTCRKFYVGLYRSGQYVIVDSFRVDIHGRFSIDPDLPAGCSLLIACGDNRPDNMPFTRFFAGVSADSSIKLVCMNEDIQYITSWRNHSGYLKFVQGGKATDALKQLDSRLSYTQQRLFHIEKLYVSTTRGSSFSKTLEKEMQTEAGRFNAFCDSVSASFPKDSYMAIYATMYKQVTPAANPALDDPEEWKAEHLFDHVDLQNPVTADIPLFQGIIRHYHYLSQPKGLATTADMEAMWRTAKEKLVRKCGFPLDNFFPDKPVNNE
jgi:hypothetical protein